MRFASATIRGLSFDAGMTLVLPAHPIPETYRGLASEVGVEVDSAAFDAHLGGTWRSLRAPTTDEEARTDEAIEAARWRELTHEVARPFPELARSHAAWHEALVAHYDRGEAWVVAPGALQALAALRGAGLPLVVLSNWHRGLHGILEAHGLTGSFDAVLVSSEIGWRKPHERAFGAVTETMGLAAHEILHVGDSPAEDVEAARRCGLQALLFAPDHPDSNNPEGVLRDWGELPTILGLP